MIVERRAAAASSGVGVGVAVGVGVVVGSSVEAVVGVVVGTGVEAFVGIVVGSGVEAFVGIVVGSGVEAFVGDGVACSSGAGVAVASSVGEAVRPGVGAGRGASSQADSNAEPIRHSKPVHKVPRVASRTLTGMRQALLFLSESILLLISCEHSPSRGRRAGAASQYDLGMPKTFWPRNASTRLFVTGADIRRRVSRNLRSMS